MSQKTNKILEAIKKRRTIRSYLPDPVPSEHINLILDAARWAPSAANLQPWQFIVVKNETTKRSFQELVEENRKLTVEMREEPFKSGFSKYKTEWICDAPVHIVVCVDPKRTAPHVGGEETYKHAAGAAIQNLMLAAHSLGLGSCWLSMFNKDKLKTLLGIPSEMDIAGVITIGYPKHIPKTPETTKRYGGKPRRELEEIVFYEKYGQK